MILSVFEPVAAIYELVSETPVHESAKVEETALSGPREARENEIIREESVEEQCKKGILVKPEEAELVPEIELFMPRNSALIQ